MPLFVAPDTVDGIQLMMSSAVVDKYENGGLIAEKGWKEEVFSARRDLPFLTKTDSRRAGGPKQFIFLYEKKRRHLTRKKKANGSAYFWL